MYIGKRYRFIERFKDIQHNVVLNNPRNIQYIFFSLLTNRAYLNYQKFFYICVIFLTFTLLKDFNFSLNFSLKFCLIRAFLPLT